MSFHLSQEIVSSFTCPLKDLYFCIFFELATYHWEQCCGGLVSHPGRGGGSWPGNSSWQFTVLKPREALTVWASMACFNPLNTSIHIQILQTDLNAFLNPLSPKSDQWSWELRTWSHKMNLIDTSTNSPHYFHWKQIRTTNENLNFDIRV